MAKNGGKTLLGGTSKKFRKSFRGIVTGKIWKETKKPKKNTQKSSESPSVAGTKSISSTSFDEEIICVYEIDGVSKVKVPTAATIDSQTEENQIHTEPLADLIIIMLLLIDPTSRRFQLLRLEVDTTKSTVAEILQRIPHLPATEESLRTHTFDCMCDIEGLEYNHEKHISEYVDGNAVVIAVPNTNANTKGTENVTRIAKSILQRRNVDAMLKAAGIFNPSVQLKENLEQEDDSSPTSEDMTSKCTGRSIKPTALSPLTSSSKRPQSSNCVCLGDSMVDAALDLMKKFSFRIPITSKIWIETKKSKKNTQKSSESPSVVGTKSISSISFDDETIDFYELDGISKVPTAATIDLQTEENQIHTEPLADLIIIMLLLIDPITRRFQLLRLELDITKSTVAEILQRIPHLPATEESLRTQTFDCMCDIEGLEYNHEKHISEYIDGNAVVIAVPNTNANTTGTENVTRIANSILQRREVDAMLKAAGIFNLSVQLKENLEQEEDSSPTSEDMSSKCIGRSIKPTALCPLTPYSQRQLKAADDAFYACLQINTCLELEEDPSPSDEDTTPKRMDIFIKSPTLSSLLPSSKRHKSSNHSRHPIFAGVSPTFDGQINVFQKEEAMQELNLEEIQHYNSALREVYYESPGKRCNQSLLCA